MDKAREWYIEIGVGKLDINKPYKRYVSANPFGGMVGDEDYPNAEVVHVIEYSALTSLQDELERERKDYCKHMNAIDQSLENCRDKIKALEQQLSKANEVIERLSKKLEACENAFHLLRIKMPVRAMSDSEWSVVHDYEIIDQILNSAKLEGGSHD